eukprot:1104565-Prymnesium_polylepis.1
MCRWRSAPGRPSRGGAARAARERCVASCIWWWGLCVVAHRRPRALSAMFVASRSETRPPPSRLPE